MPIVTLKILTENRSARGGYTKDQLAALGVSWPPKKGWLKKMIGMEISQDELDRFSLKPAPDLIKITSTTKPAVAGETSGGCTQKP